MFKYTTVLLDADQTVFDFLSAENAAVKAVLKKNGLPHDEKTAQLYSRINDSFWKRLEKGEIKREEIFVGRYKELVRQLNSTVSAEKLNDDYFIELPLHSKLFPGAEEFLQALKGAGLQVGLVTNGAAVTQRQRIERLKCGHLFDGIFISEEIGYTKPDKEYFNFVLKSLNITDKSKVIMIGDSPSADVAGGVNAGIDTCYFSKNGETCTPTPTYIAKSYNDMLKIIGL